ncbi:MAG: pilus assembly protein N-terminal domain-containing protein [Gemmatimonadota bacterium]|nr:pilus assembly protein N-terminal domain-containing protein [Gemmatimonadota bacterium]MDQ8167893.1 pilus assembly protein N-terminal domain-containing protein [Gemmatimonadota bacterium]MDQ8173779.1 pilus assembly protein N-terminal domain-containing protein [Gemmatimonadota bacterium]
MTFARLRCLRVALLSACLLAPALASPAQAQDVAGIERITIALGRSLPIDLPGAVTQVTIVNPDVADVVVLTERSVVLNAKAIGATDIILSGASIGRRHLRVTVFAATDRRQISLSVKFAEVRRDALTELGISGEYKNGKGTSAAGTGAFSSPASGTVAAASTASKFLSAISTFGTDDIRGYLEAQQQSGRARSLAEPTLMAGNKDSASFLAGGEVPVPIAQPSGAAGQSIVTIVYRPFGVQLKFIGEVLNDSLIKLRVVPEVSSLDYGNAVLISGFRVPALRTRRVETTLDVRPGESLVISGLFSDDRESVRTGIPGLMNIPILGALFSSTRWQSSESELLVVVTPELVDPNLPRALDRVRLKPDTTLPAVDALKKRLPPS